MFPSLSHVSNIDQSCEGLLPLPPFLSPPLPSPSLKNYPIVLAQFTFDIPPTHPTLFPVTTLTARTSHIPLHTSPPAHPTLRLPSHHSYCEERHLEWGRRCRLIQEELRKYDCDLVCMQV